MADPHTPLNIWMARERERQAVMDKPPPDPLSYGPQTAAYIREAAARDHASRRDESQGQPPAQERQPHVQIRQYECSDLVATAESITGVRKEDIWIGPVRRWKNQAFFGGPWPVGCYYEALTVNRSELEQLIQTVEAKVTQVEPDASRLEQKIEYIDGCNEQARKDKAEIKQLKLDKDTLRRRVAYVKEQVAIANEDIERLGGVPHGTTGESASSRTPVDVPRRDPWEGHCGSGGRRHHARLGAQGGQDAGLGGSSRTSNDGRGRREYGFGGKGTWYQPEGSWRRNP